MKMELFTVALYVTLVWMRYGIGAANGDYACGSWTLNFDASCSGFEYFLVGPKMGRSVRSAMSTLAMIPMLEAISTETVF